MSFLRARERRVQVSIKARVRSEIGWGDSQICNVSSRGMMVRHIPPPPLGSYVEVCRGPFSIVGRVRWIAGDRFGLQALEDIDLGDLQNPQVKIPDPPAERRRRPRPLAAASPATADLAARLAGSQRLARRLQLAVVALAGPIMALILTTLAAETLAAPLDRVSLALAEPG